MANLIGTQDNAHEGEGSMGRKVKVSELRKGMRVAHERAGWRSELTVFELQTPEQGGISSWTVYADNNGGRGELHCFRDGTEFEVLEEAPLPPEPGVNSIVRLGTVDYQNTGYYDNMPWHRLDSRIPHINGIPMLSYQGWADLVDRAALAGVEIEIVYEPVRVEAKYAVGDKLDELPEDTSGLEGYVFRTPSGDYMFPALGGWSCTSVLELAKRGSVRQADIDGHTLKLLNQSEAVQFTVTAIPEGE